MTAQLYPPTGAPAIYPTPQTMIVRSTLYWLAERATPPGANTKHDDGPQGDVFVTTGDTVLIYGDVTGVIVGAEGYDPCVRVTESRMPGRKPGQVVTIDPDDIVGAIIVRRLMAGA